MSEYIITLDASQDIALQYALELALAGSQPMPPEGEEPPPLPTLETMPQAIINADLANRRRDLESLATQTVAVLDALKKAGQPLAAACEGLTSQALRAYVAARGGA